MSGAELALGIVGAVAAVDVAIRACKTVIETCSAVKNAEEEIYERSTRLLSNSMQIATQLEIFRQIEDQLDAQGQNVQEQIFEILVLKLNNADARLKGLVRNRSLKPDSNNPRGKYLLKRERANYALQKSSLDKAIDEVESWQRLSFNPLWFATMKAQTKHFDKELHHAKRTNQSLENEMMAATMAVRNPLRDIRSVNVFLPAEKLKSAKVTRISFSRIQLVEIDHKWRLLDSVSTVSRDAVRQLAVRLKKANPSSFGLLTCLGAVHHHSPGSDVFNHNFDIIFRTPDGMSEPTSLRATLMASDMVHSLSERFRLANQLARAVFSVHSFDMVHKSIRPENIVLFSDSESTLGSAFLLGFEKIRLQDDSTRLTANPDWDKSIYRHPQRQGSRIRDRYIMQHDIYSLGVCLLEIGLWSSFVEYSLEGFPVWPQTYNLRPERYNEFDYPELVKSRLLSLTTKELPGKMGTKYSKIVESCLTCLDLGNEDFNDEPELQVDDASVAVRYIEKVLLRLSEISV